MLHFINNSTNNFNVYKSSCLKLDSNPFTCILVNTLTKKELTFNLTQTELKIRIEFEIELNNIDTGDYTFKLVQNNEIVYMEKLTVAKNCIIDFNSLNATVDTKVNFNIDFILLSKSKRIEVWIIRKEQSEPSDYFKVAESSLSDLVINYLLNCELPTISDTYYTKLIFFNECGSSEFIQENSFIVP